MAELGEIVRGAVGEGSISLSPDELGGVELGRVRREVVDVQPGMAREEGGDITAAVDRTTVPEQVYGAGEMPEQVAQERLDVEAGEIAGATVEIDGQPPLLGRDRQPAADRQAIVPVAMAQGRGLPSRGPRPTDVGNEQKPTLIDEDEVGAPARGVFLSGARPCASTGRWPPRPARLLAAPASDNSSPAP